MILTEMFINFKMQVFYLVLNSFKNQQTHLRYHILDNLFELKIKFKIVFISQCYNLIITNSLQSIVIQINHT